jgi:L-threonylcarbamoyladenylate synthase
VTDVIRVDPENPDAEAIARAARCLRDGGLVAFPTETVYGLGVHALDRAAVRRLFEAKERPATDPLIVHVASSDLLEPLVSTVSDAARSLARRFWPGPLTLVLPRSAVVPDEVTAGLPGVALRAPSHPVARALLRAAGIPIAAPSANLFSRPSPTRAAHVLDDLDGRIDLLVDAGETTIGVESTVLDLTSDPPAVLRPGAITVEMLAEVLQGVVAAGPRATESGPAAAPTPMPSPGLLEKHYSPRAPLTLFEGASGTVLEALVASALALRLEGRRVGIIAADEDQQALSGLVGEHHVVLRMLGPLAASDTHASRLYGVLRELDAAGVDVILARGLPVAAGIGVAVQDRLRRAAGRIVRR